MSSLKQLFILNSMRYLSTEKIELMSNFENTLTWIDIVTALGSVLAIILSLIALLINIRDRKKEKIDNTFFNLLNLFRNIQNEQSDDKKNFKNKLTALHEKKAEIISRKSRPRQEGYFISEFSNVLEDVLKSDLREQEYNDDRIKKTIKKLITKVIQNKSDYPKMYEDLTNGYTIFESDRYKAISYYNKELACLYKKTLNIQLNEFNEAEKKEVNEKVFRKNEFGSYFRSLHRVIKYINENVTNMEIKKNYIGFLRAILSEEELLLIYYNAFYTDRGKGLKNELIKTNFFGEKDDLPLVDSEPQHFKSESLVWKEVDIQNMRTCILQTKNPWYKFKN